MQGVAAKTIVKMIGPISPIRRISPMQEPMEVSYG